MSSEGETGKNNDGAESARLRVGKGRVRCRQRLEQQGGKEEKKHKKKEEETTTAG